MNKKEFFLNSSELHIISGLDIDYCRHVFKENYLPSKSTIDVLEKYTGLDLEAAYDHFKENWFKYRDNAAYILNAPFTKNGFKVSKKAQFILDNVNPDHRQSILENWECKKEALKRQVLIE